MYVILFFSKNVILWYKLPFVHYIIYPVNILRKQMIWEGFNISDLQCYFYILDDIMLYYIKVHMYLNQNPLVMSILMYRFIQDVRLLPEKSKTLKNKKTRLIFNNMAFTIRLV